MTQLPTGAIGFVHETDSFISRTIAKHERVKYSHVVIALGNGKVFDQRFLWSRIKPESFWTDSERGVDWYAPTLTPFSDSQARVLRSAAYALEGRTFYDVPALFRFLGFGRPRRGRGLFCSYAVAELLMIARDEDVSRTEEPWLVGVRDLVVYLIQAVAWQRIMWRGLLTPKQERALDSAAREYVRGVAERRSA